jgi:hypothetical protein
VNDRTGLSRGDRNRLAPIGHQLKSSVAGF